MGIGFDVSVKLIVFVIGFCKCVDDFFTEQISRQCLESGVPRLPSKGMFKYRRSEKTPLGSQLIAHLFTKMITQTRVCDT
jgi:hypothetical protein